MEMLIILVLISQGATWDGTGTSPFDYGNLNFTIEIVGLAEEPMNFSLRMPMDVQKLRKLQ